MAFQKRHQAVNARGELPKGGKVRVPTTSMQHKQMGAKHGDAHPCDEHKGGGYRMTGQSGAKGSPFRA